MSQKYNTPGRQSDSGISDYRSPPNAGGASLFSPTMTPGRNVSIYTQQAQALQAARAPHTSPATQATPKQAQSSKNTPTPKQTQSSKNTPTPKDTQGSQPTSKLSHGHSSSPRHPQPARMSPSHQGHPQSQRPLAQQIDQGQQGRQGHHRSPSAMSGSVPQIPTNMARHARMPETSATAQAFRQPSTNIPGLPAQVASQNPIFARHSHRHQPSTQAFRSPRIPTLGAAGFGSSNPGAPSLGPPAYLSQRHASAIHTQSNTGQTQQLAIKQGPSPFSPEPTTRMRTASAQPPRRLQETLESLSLSGGGEQDNQHQVYGALMKGIQGLSKRLFGLSHGTIERPDLPLDFRHALKMDFRSIDHNINSVLEYGERLGNVLLEQSSEISKTQDALVKSQEENSKLIQTMAHGKSSYQNVLDTMEAERNNSRRLHVLLGERDAAIKAKDDLIHQLTDRNKMLVEQLEGKRSIWHEMQRQKQSGPSEASWALQQYQTNQAVAARREPSPGIINPTWHAQEQGRSRQSSFSTGAPAQMVSRQSSLNAGPQGLDLSRPSSFAAGFHADPIFRTAESVFRGPTGGSNTSFVSAGPGDRRSFHSSKPSLSGKSTMGHPSVAPAFVPGRPVSTMQAKPESISNPKPAPARHSRGPLSYGPGGNNHGGLPSPIAESPASQALVQQDRPTKMRTRDEVKAEMIKYSSPPRLRDSMALVLPGLWSPGEKGTGEVDTTWWQNRFETLFNVTYGFCSTHVGVDDKRDMVALLSGHPRTWLMLCLCMHHNREIGERAIVAVLSQARTRPYVAQRLLCQVLVSTILERNPYRGFNKVADGEFARVEELLGAGDCGREERQEMLARKAKAVGLVREDPRWKAERQNRITEYFEVIKGSFWPMVSHSRGADGREEANQDLFSVAELATELATAMTLSEHDFQFFWHKTGEEFVTAAHQAVESSVSPEELESRGGRITLVAAPGVVIKTKNENPSPRCVLRAKVLVNL